MQRTSGPLDDGRLLFGDRDRLETAPTKVQDPVCGMLLDATATALVAHQKGYKYFFCSEACLARFRKEPELFTG